MNIHNPAQIFVPKQYKRPLCLIKWNEGIRRQKLWDVDHSETRI